MFVQEIRDGEPWPLFMPQKGQRREKIIDYSSQRRCDISRSHLVYLTIFQGWSNLPPLCPFREQWEAGFITSFIRRGSHEETTVLSLSFTNYDH